MAQPKKKGAKKKEKRIVPSGTAYVLASFNNTVVTITDLEGNVVCWSSAGSLGFKGVAQGDAVCRAAGCFDSGNTCPRSWNAHAGSECEGTRLWPRFCNPRTSDRRPGDPRDTRHDADSAQRMPAAEETTRLRSFQGDCIG
jgi:hypothetical protein